MVVSCYCCIFMQAPRVLTISLEVDLRVPADGLCTAGDVPVLPPVQAYGGALRASLEQRAPTAVRDYVAPRLAPTRAQDSSGSSWGRRAP